ncbi:MAG: hypothetical protein C4321_10520, partial [Chloroflexota bacterium]
FASVWVTRIVRRGLTARRALGAAAVLTLGALLRSEGILFGVALGSAAAWVLWRKRLRSDACVTFAATAGSVVVATAIDSVWRFAITGAGAVAFESSRAGGAGLFGRLQGAGALLIGGGSLNRSADLVAVLGVGCMGLAVVGLRRSHAEAIRDVACGVALASILWGARMVFWPGALVTGLFIAWPAATFGLALLRRGWLRDAHVALTVVAFVGLVGVTQYPEAGGTEWGARFLSPVQAALACLTALGLVGWWEQLRPVGRTAMVLAAAVAAVAGVAMGIGALVHFRGNTARVLKAATSTGAQLVVTPHTHLPRLAWRSERSWMVVPKDEIVPVVEDLANAGAAPVAIVLAEPVGLSRLSPVEGYDVVLFGPVRVPGRREEGAGRRHGFR